MTISVVGTGAWGTALGAILSEKGHQVVVWGHDTAYLREMAASRRNPRYLPDLLLPESWSFEEDLARAVGQAELCVMATPSQVFRDVLSRVHGIRMPIVSVTKGVEYETGLTMSGIVAQLHPEVPVAALSGPTLAQEIAAGLPAAVVAASRDGGLAETVQSLFHLPRFRVYTSRDPRGVELGGALKNVIAIAAGVCDGRRFGDNSKAGLVTRAIAEMRRLGVACGAQPETFSGLSGLGDLTVTCFSKLSRNRAFGERLGRGIGIQQALAENPSVVEGYPTSKSAFQLARRLGVYTPIMDEVYALLYEAKAIPDAVHSLLTRDSKAED